MTILYFPCSSFLNGSVSNCYPLPAPPPPSRPPATLHVRYMGKWQFTFVSQVHRWAGIVVQELDLMNCTCGTSATPGLVQTSEWCSKGMRLLQNLRAGGCIFLVGGTWIIGPPVNTHILVVTPLYNSLPLTLSRTCDLILTNGMRHRGRNVTSVHYVGLDKMVNILSADSLYWLSPLLALMKWAVVGRGKELRVASSSQPAGSQALSLTTYNKLNPVNSHVSLAAYPSPVKP